MGNFGFQELLLIFVSLVLGFAIPVILIVWLYKTFRSSQSNKQRIDELERKLMEMEERLKA